MQQFFYGELAMWYERLMLLSEQSRDRADSYTQYILYPSSYISCTTTVIDQKWYIIIYRCHLLTIDENAST